MKTTFVAIACALALLTPSVAFAGGGMNCGFGDWPFSSALSDTPETVRVFPTYAVVGEDGKTVKIPLRAWVFEDEKDRLRGYAVKKIAEKLGIESGTPEYAIFSRRMHDFMVDNESGKKVWASFSGKGLKPAVVELGESGSDGHVSRVVELPYDPPKRAKKRSIRLAVTLDRSDVPERTVDIPVIDADGVTVVSDIDDTIKITNVVDRKEMFDNTFRREFQPAPGMANLYAKWASPDTTFHYVSASPWTLYKDLSAFADAHGFPSGVYHLRVLKLSDAGSVSAFVGDSSAHKIDSIEALMRDFPKRKFVLVGDTGERDPEIYAGLAERHPDRIEKIYLRRVEGANNAEERFAKTFAKVPKSKWVVFEDASSL